MGDFCALCLRDVEELVDAPCYEKPELLVGLPIGMYHCPDCGMMLVACCKHPQVCNKCRYNILKELNINKDTIV